jgi:hypothetical protein
MGKGGARDAVAMMDFKKKRGGRVWVGLILRSNSLVR